MRYIIIILLAAALVGCKSGTNSHKGHNHEETGVHAEGDSHDHEWHDHEGHSHAVGEAHDHAIVEINDHTGHDHGEMIVFTHIQAEAAGLVVETVEPAPFSQTIKAAGRIEVPQGEEAVVAATSSGIVSFAGDVLTEGRPVRRGEAIVAISAQGLIDGDPAARARIEFEAAEQDYRRAEQLVKDRIISQKDFDEVLKRYETAREAYPANTSASGVSVASPIGGYIKNLLVGQGEYVSVGQPIATITQNSKLQLRAEVSERHFPRLSNISGANFKLPYDETLYHTGRLLSYGRSSEGFYIPVLFEFDNKGGVLPGAYVEVWLLGEPVQNTISIPKSALTEEQGLYFVYLQHGQEEYVKQEVAVGADNGERVQISKGLESGDRVVTRGAIQVRLAAMSGIVPEGHGHAH